MAKVYRSPIPYIQDYSTDFREWQKQDEEYLTQLVELAKKNRPNSDLIGEIVSWPRGDGYAQYMVWNTRPLELVWLEIGDAWSVEDALIRGLRLKDIENMIAGERKLRALFGGPVKI